jgi:3-polyprenyl-4-hydroxybenzoate decarboxylase
MEELTALLSRLKAIVTEIEAVISNQPKKKLSKEEYLAKSEDERNKYDEEQMKEEPKKEEEKE